MTAVLDSFLSVGYFAAPLIAFAVIPSMAQDMGWRVLFYIGGFPLLFVPALLKWMPESPRWLEVKGHGCKGGQHAMAAPGANGLLQTGERDGTGVDKLPGKCNYYTVSYCRRRPCMASRYFQQARRNCCAFPQCFGPDLVVFPAASSTCYFSG